MADTALRRQLVLLRGAPGFRLLFQATLWSGLGTWLAVIALTVDVFDRTGSGVWVSALLVADFLPAVAIGLLLGPLVDRVSRQRLMIASDLVRFGVFCALPFSGSATGVVALAAVAGFATGFFRPAVYAGLPNLVEDSDLPSANSLLQSVENLTALAGPLAGGALVAASSPDVAYWLNAASFLVSAALIAGIPARRLQAGAGESEGHWRDLAHGLSLVWSSRSLLTVLVTWSLVVVSIAGVNVSEVVLAKVTFDAGDFGFGLLAAAFGLGLVAGSLFAGSLLERHGTAKVYGGSIALLALGLAAAAVSPDIWVAAACVAVSATGNGAAVVCNALLVQRGVPDQMRGRAFTVIMSANFVVLGLGMVAAGPLTDAFGARWVWGGAAALVAVAAAIGFALARGVPEPGAEEREEAQPLAEAEQLARL